MKKKILIILFLIALALVLYLILTAESAGKQNGAKQPAETKRAAPLADAYEPRARELFKDFEVMARGSDAGAEKINELKSKLLGLTVPARFKQLHLNFVRLLDKMQSGEKALSQQMASQLKADYGWLNN